jgi:mevalonate kinase
MVQQYTIPGKVFVLGEYAVLVGSPALVATLPPRFRLFSDDSDHSKVADDADENIHCESPLGKLQSWAKQMGLKKLKFHFEDPLKGAGGFGASTAQFGMGYLAYALRNGLNQNWQSVWKLYRELMSDQQLIPSGADLVAQWEGGIVSLDFGKGICNRVESSMDWSNLLVFSTTHQQGRKVPTHVHLQKLAESGFPASKTELGYLLHGTVTQGLSALENNDAALLGKAMNQTAEILNRFDLEIQSTTEDRKVLMDIPDVLGVKGAGALQSDAILVLMKSGSSQVQQVIEVAQGRGLNLLCNGVKKQMGILCQS